MDRSQSRTRFGAWTETSFPPSGEKSRLLITSPAWFGKDFSFLPVLRSHRRIGSPCIGEAVARHRPSGDSAHWCPVVFGAKISKARCSERVAGSQIWIL